MSRKKLPDRMSHAAVARAIRACHLKANIDAFERKPELLGRPDWANVYIDSGGTVFGGGPYLHVPIKGGEFDGTRRRVYPPARLRKQLARRWPRPSRDTMPKVSAL